MKVKLSEIFVGERRRKETMNVEDMMKQLEDDGQITAITLREPQDYDRSDPVYNGEPYALVAGGRRFAAAARLGWTEIEAITKEGPVTELRHRVWELHENLHREDMSWQEIVDSKREILELRKLENPEITQQEVAREIGDDPGNFSRDVQVSEAMAERPSLKNSSSKKQALRVSKMMDHEEQRQARQKKKAEAAGEGEEQAGAAVVVAADARNWLGDLEESSVDLILTDPPYGIDYWKGGHKMVANPGGNLGISEYDDSEEAATDLIHVALPLAVRALRPTGWLCMFAGRELLNLVQGLLSDLCAEHYGYRKEGKGESNKCVFADGETKCRFLVPEAKPWIWYRPGSRNRSRYPELHARNVYEDIVICNMGKAMLAKECDNVLVHEPDYSESRIHANQKPIDLAVELVERLTSIGDLVVDFCAGSGALLAGAAKKGREVKGCELNEDIVVAANGLISQYYHPVSSGARELAKRRHEEQMKKNVIGLDDFSEING